jgi:hypothetical protein
MSNFLEKIPVSPITSFGSPSVTNGSTIGTNFSILQVGGYMEVYSLSGLTYTIPPVTGQIEFTGNTIPIHFTKGSGSVFSPDVLTLNSDNISSGRRKLGMLVYVYETDKIYQYTIDNYETLWNNATGATGPGGPTVVISDFGTTVKNNSPEGIAFINAWTSSTISGIDGYDDTNASWRVLQTGGSGVSITGGSFNNTTDTLTLNNSTGGTITITGFTDYYTTGFTFNPSNYDLTIERNDGLPSLSVNLSILASDVTITGGTYNSSTGTVTFTNNTGGTFNVTGFLTGFTDIYVTGGTFNNSTKILTLRRSDNININISGFTDTFVTGATKSGTVATFTNNTGGTFTLTGLTDVFVTGGTYSSSTGITTFRNNTGGTFNISGYFKPSDDIYVTGGTVSHGPNEANNVLYLNRSDNNTVTIQNLVDVYEISRDDLLGVIADKAVIKGKTYKVNKCDSVLYDNGTNSESDNVYTTIYLIGVSNSKVSESGIGVFYTPKYSDISIFVELYAYTESDLVIWGGYVWRCKTSGTYNSLDAFTLDTNYWVLILPFTNSNELNTEDYTIRYDDVIYDIDNDIIIYRNEENINIVSTTVENIDYWVNKKSFYNPIKAFQWGNVYSKDKGIGNQVIINSYNENINYTGDYQINFYFEGGSYLRNNFVEVGSYQRNFYFKDNSYQDDSTLTRISSQNSLFLTNNSYISKITLSQSYQDNIYLDNDSYMDGISITKGSHQTSIKLNGYSYFENIILKSDSSYQDSLCFTNNSYQSNITFGPECYQFNFNFNNGSYQNIINLQNNGKFSQQEYFDFNNGSYQSNITIDSNKQEYFTFNNGYQYHCSDNKGQSYIVIENGSQINGFTDAQDKITIKGYNLDWGSYASIAQSGLFFIHNLPNETTTSLIGKKDNRLVEVSDLYFDGNKWVLTGNITVGGLTATTLSASTYLGLPIDIRVTGATKSGTVATFTNNTGGTFTLTGLTDTFVTGVTYINNTFTYTNNTGGTFSVFFNTMTGLTVNTISAQTFYNQGVDIISSLYNVESTGTDDFSGLTRVSATQFNVAPVHGYIVNNDSINKTIIEVNYSGITNQTTPFLNTDVATYVLINSGSTLVLQNTYPTPTERRDNIFLGRIAHPDKTSIVTANNTSDFIQSPMSVIRDMFTPIPLINSGIVVTPNGTNLSINTSAGSLYGLGINYYLNKKNPDVVSISGNSPTTFQYRTQTGGTLSNTTLIDPTNYDLNGVITPIGSPAKQATNQRIYLFPSGQIRIQYGQQKYSDLTSAVANVLTEPFITFSNNRDNAILIGIISVASDATDLSNPLEAYFSSVSKFGELLGGTGGLSTTTLQQAYDNSTTPEIVINSTLDGLSIKNGTGNADNITNLIEGINSGGTTTSFVRSDGLFSGNSVSTPGFTANTNGATGVTISASTYLGLPTDIRVTGGTYSGDTIIFTNNTGGTFNVTGITSSSQFTGGIVSGATNFTGGLTANTISATTYQNLPPISLDGLSDVTISTGVTTGNTLMFDGSFWQNVDPFDYFDAKPVIYQRHTNMPTFGSASINNVEGVVIIASGSQGVRSWADTNLVTRGQRLGIVVSLTGGLSQLRQTLNYMSINGGFDMITAFSMSENATDTAIRFFIGLTTNNIFTNVEPNTLLNIIGICRLSSSNNLHLINNDNTGTATTLDLGSNFPANTIDTDKYQLNIKTISGGIYLKLDRLGTSFYYETTIISDIPSNSTGLKFGAYIVDTSGPSVSTGFDWYGTHIKI